MAACFDVNREDLCIQTGGPTGNDLSHTGDYVPLSELSRMLVVTPRHDVLFTKRIDIDPAKLDEWKPSVAPLLED